jgi:hypothetical protein
MKLILAFLIMTNASAVFANKGMSYIEFTMKKEEQARFKNLQNYKKKYKKKRKITKSKRKSSKKRLARKVVQKVSTKKAALSTIQSQYQAPAVYKVGEALSFNYHVQYNGPSLDESNYQRGATYNRAETGQDYKGEEFDSTGSYQMYHALTIGYQINKNYKVFYGYTFQENLYSDVKFEYKNDDGSTGQGTKAKGPTDNNKRLGLNMFNVIDNSYINFSPTVFYELPSTYGSESSDMLYGIGIQPSLTIKNNTPGLTYGIGGEFQRNYFKKNETHTAGFKYPTRNQTFLAQIAPFLNYKMGEVTTFKSSLMFDWDQKGDQVNSNDEWNDNMHNVGRVGFDFYLGYGITTGSFIEFATEEASLNKTMIGANLNMSLF